MRKKFLVKPKLQFKHLSWTLGTVVVSCVAGYYLFESMIGQSLLSGPLGDAEWMVLREKLRYGLALVVALLLVAIGLENYLFFHSVVGPIYALEKGLKRLSEGNFKDKVQIRDTDQFGELIVMFEEVKGRIKKRMVSNEKTALLLARELDQILENATLENIKSLREKLRQIRIQVEKDAA